MSKWKSLCATIVCLLAACAAPVYNQADVDRVTNDIKMANEGDRDAAYRVCDNYYQLNKVVYNTRELVDTAWYWCSNLAKENNPAAQYRAGMILWTYDTSYGHQYFNPITDVYVEGLYWLQQAANNGYPGAAESYQYHKKFWDGKYGAGRNSDGLFGKIIAGAFIAGVGISANASAATTAAAVGAFAADASTNGQAGASAKFLKNAQGPSQLPPRKVALPIADVTPLPTQQAPTKNALPPAVKKTPAERKQEAAAKKAEDRQIKNAAAEKKQAALTLADNKTKASPKSTTAPRASSNGCIARGDIADLGKMPVSCHKDRNNTFGWGDTKAAACEGAQRSVKEEFDAESHNPSGCYCKANAKVNSVVQPFVCYVNFD